MTEPGPVSPLPPPRPIERGNAALSVERANERRLRASRRSVSRVAEAWVRESFRERRLGNHLDRTLGVFAIVLHDRIVPASARVVSSHIDHIVVAASGVWVVDAQHDAGRISRGSNRLFTAGVTEDVAVVQECVDCIGYDWLDVTGALCFTNGRWGRLTKAFQSDGAWVLGPKSLTDLISASGPLRPEDIQTVAAELSRRLRPAH